MKKSQATEEHVPQAADIVEDDTDVDIDKTSFVHWNLPLSPLITYQSHWRVCVDTELSWSLFTFTSISTDCTMYTGAAAVAADNCLISYCTLVHFALLLLYTFYFIGNYSMFIMIVVINNKMKWKMHLHRVSWISKIILECIKAYIIFSFRDILGVMMFNQVMYFISTFHPSQPLIRMGGKYWSQY